MPQTLTEQLSREQQIAALEKEWASSPRWKGVNRTYSAADVIALQGSVVEEQTLARRGAEVLWKQLHDMEFVNALGALTGNMAVQQVRGQPQHEAHRRRRGGWRAC